MFMMNQNSCGIPQSSPLSQFLPVQTQMYLSHNLGKVSNILLFIWKRIPDHTSLLIYNENNLQRKCLVAWKRKKLKYEPFPAQHQETPTQCSPCPLVTLSVLLSSSSLTPRWSTGPMSGPMAMCSHMCQWRERCGYQEPGIVITLGRMVGRCHICYVQDVSHTLTQVLSHW